jgi:hypothetical protein
LGRPTDAIRGRWWHLLSPRRARTPLFHRQHPTYPQNPTVGRLEMREISADRPGFAVGRTQSRPGRFRLGFLLRVGSLSATLGGRVGPVLAMAVGPERSGPRLFGGQGQGPTGVGREVGPLGRDVDGAGGYRYRDAIGRRGDKSGRSVGALGKPIPQPAPFTKRDLGCRRAGAAPRKSTNRN